MNSELAQAAIDGITDTRTERAPGYCSRWVRQVVEKLYPGIYDGLFAGSANETGLNFEHAGYGQPAANAGTIQIGDILVKEFAPFGHIGIYVGEQGVAENSSTRIGRVLGAKGYRTLAQWGRPAIVVRLPQAKPTQPAGYRLMLNDVPVGEMPVIQGAAQAPVRPLCKRLGLDLDIDEATMHPIIGGHEYSTPITIINDVGFLSVRPLATFLGLSVTVDEGTKTAILSRV
jgi:hypothetical protein